MYFIYDNLAATLVAMTVLLMLAAMQQRMQEAGVERVLVYAAKKQSLDFGDWLQQDFVNIGANLPPSMQPVTEPVPFDTTSNLTGSFTFFKQFPGDASPSTVVYQLTTVFESDGVTPQVVEMDTTLVPLYQVQRLVNGVVSGQSAPAITFFDIDLVGPTGAIGVPASAANQVRVRFSMAVGSGMQTARRTYLRETHWGTTVPFDN